MNFDVFRLDKLNNDELLLFYALLVDNERYSTISSLKKAIVNRMNKNSNNYLNSILRGLRDE